MEEKFNGGQENHEERRDYARNEGSANNYSAEGRRLRPRRKVGSYSENNHRNYSEGNSNRTGRPAYGQGGERRSYGQSRPRYGEDRPRYGEDKPRFGSDRPRYGSDRPRYGSDRPRYNNDRPQRSEGSPRYGEDRPHYDGERPRYNNDRPRFGSDRPRYNNDRPQRSENRPKFGEDRPRFSEGRPQRFKPAPRKPARKSGPHFTNTDEAGINQMLSRKPQIDNHAFSDNDTVPTPIKEEIRLNKFIANSGVCSRREADTLIQAGVVTVNGEVVTELGTKVNVLKDDIRFNGERLKGEEKVYIVMNKPKGFVTSAFHGGLEQRQREDALYKFSNGSATVLVSTDLASRGLDIPQIENIIHYHLPSSEDALIHRVGRTARWDQMGKTFFLVGPEEHVPEFVEGEIKEYSLPALHREGVGVSLPRMSTLYIGKGKKDKISKGDIVGFLCKKGGLVPSEIGRIDVNDRYAYAAVSREKAQQVIRLTQGEKIKGIRTVVELVR